MNLERVFGGTPAEWIPHGGRPAKCLGFEGMPSYERDEGHAVYDFLSVHAGAGGIQFVPSFYGAICALAPEGLAPLYARVHDPRPVERAVGNEKVIGSLDVGAPRHWRPWIYHRESDHISCMGSQTEMLWRHSIHGMLKELNGGGDEQDMTAACERARNLLLENLTPHQRIQFAARNAFAVRGALTRNMYWIELGNGFAILDKTTAYRTVSYCYHPTYWMPHEDVALATKLALEDPELEQQVLETAKVSLCSYPERPVTRAEKYARDIECELVT